MTFDLFSRRTIATPTEQAVVRASTRSSVATTSVGQFHVNYAIDTSNLPIDSIFVRNQKGYKNLSLSVDEFQQSGKRLRVDSLDKDGNVSNSVFVGEKALGAFIEAATILMNYNMEG